MRPLKSCFCPTAPLPQKARMSISYALVRRGESPGPGGSKADGGHRRKAVLTAVRYKPRPGCQPWRSVPLVPIAAGHSRGLRPRFRSAADGLSNPLIYNTEKVGSQFLSLRQPGWFRRKSGESRTWRGLAALRADDFSLLGFSPEIRRFTLALSLTRASSAYHPLAHRVRDARGVHRGERGLVVPSARRSCGCAAGDRHSRQERRSGKYKTCPRRRWADGGGFSVGACGTRHSPRLVGAAALRLRA